MSPPAPQGQVPATTLPTSVLSAGVGDTEGLGPGVARASSVAQRVPRGEVRAACTRSQPPPAAWGVLGWPLPPALG